MKTLHPRAEQRFREQTAKDTVPGIQSPRFMCATCRSSRSCHGRKKNMSGKWVCRFCLGGV